MSVTERDRQRMIRSFEQTWDQEVAMIVAEHLPPVGWADVATRQDVDALRHATEQEARGLRQDINTLGHDMQKDFEAVRHDIDALRHATQQDFDGLRREMRFEIDAARKDTEALRDAMDSRFESFEHRLSSKMDQKFAEQTRATMIGFAGALMTFGTIMLTALAVLTRP